MGLKRIFVNRDVKRFNAVILAFECILVLSKVCYLYAFLLSMDRRGEDVVYTSLQKACILSEIEYEKVEGQNVMLLFTISLHAAVINILLAQS